MINKGEPVRGRLKTLTANTDLYSHKTQRPHLISSRGRGKSGGFQKSCHLSRMVCPPSTTLGIKPQHQFRAMLTLSQAVINATFCSNVRGYDGIVTTGDISYEHLTFNKEHS